MAPLSSTLAWKIPWTEEPGGLQFMRSRRVGLDWATSTFTFHFHALEKEMATHSSVLAWRIPGTGEPGGLPSMGLHRVGHDWSDLAATDKQQLREFVTCPARNTKESPAGLNERTLDSNSKLYEEIKISVKVNTKTVIKASIIVTMICDSTFCLLHDLRN